MSFMNHGCSSSNNVGLVLNQDEASLDETDSPTKVFDYSDAEYNLFGARHFARRLTWLQAKSDIEAGDEILTNLLVSGGRDRDDHKSWTENLLRLKEFCSSSCSATDE